MGTANRLDPYNVVKYHRTPLGVLPILSHRDKALVNVLIRSAHLTTTVVAGEKNTALE